MFQPSYKQLMELLLYFCVILYIYINITVFVLNLRNVILAIPMCTYNQQKQVKFSKKFVSKFSHSQKISA